MFYYNLIFTLIFTLILPLYTLILLIRFLLGKESITTLLQQFTTYTGKIKNICQKEIIWINASGYGEYIIAKSLIEQINHQYQNKYHILVTTNKIRNKIMGKNQIDIHEFNNVSYTVLPIDHIFFTTRFVNIFKPKLAIFIESEIWPMLLYSASLKKGVNLVMINGRISDKSFKYWKKIPYIFTNIINNFDYIALQSQRDLSKYYDLINASQDKDLISLLNNKIKNFNNIKFTNKKLPVNSSYLKDLKEIYGVNKRKIILFASIHKDEEEIIISIISNIKNRMKKQSSDDAIYFIIAPRVIHDIDNLIKLCDKYAISYQLRSKDKLPSGKATLFIADSMGEMGSLYDIADLVFVGGSLYNTGGHNIVEPMMFNKPVITGGNMHNFIDITNILIKEKAILIANNKQELKLFIEEFIKNREEFNIFSKNAFDYVNKIQKSILKEYLLLIDRYL